MKFETIAIHGGYSPEPTTKSVAVPIYQTTSYSFDDTQHGADLFDLKVAGNIYTRIMNPTSDVLEKRVAAMEGGIGALALASGSAATTYAIMTICEAGDNIVSTSTLYGGTYTLFAHQLPRFGVDVKFGDHDDIPSLEKLIDKKTKAIFCESIGNPAANVVDVPEIARIAHKNNIPLIVDNTVPSPYLFRPIEHGADIVIHSLTKYINGNGTALGGVIIDAGKFDWSNGKFPEFTEPSAGYHGLVYHDVLAEASFIAKARIEGLRDLGAALSPFNAFQILQGLETLDVRMKRHSENALSLSKWLESKEEVTWVNYPGLKTSKYKSLSDKYLPNGQSGIVTFGVKGGYESAKTVADKTQIFSLLANIGDSKSLIIHPASTTHQQLNDEQQETTGVTKDLIRLSVGLEDIDDLKGDLEFAFSQIDSKVLSS